MRAVRSTIAPVLALLVAIGLASCATSEPESEEAPATVEAARLALADGDVEGALVLVRAVRERDGDSVESSLLEAWVLRQGRRFRQALEVLDGCPIPEAERSAAQVRDLEIARIDVLRDGGRTREAAARLDTMLAALAGDARESELHYRRGALLAGHGETSEALAAFATAQELAPEDWQPRCARVALYLRRGELVEARAQLDEAGAMLELHPMLAHHRALLAEAEEDVPAALDWYARALTADRAHWPSQLNRARLLEAEGLKAEAVTAYQDVLRHLPEEESARRTAIAARVDRLLASGGP